jgi:hypothetical protein
MWKVYRQTTDQMMAIAHVPFDNVCSKALMNTMVITQILTTFFFRFVDKRAIYRWYNLVHTCAGECDWLFHWQHKWCVTLSTNVNINYRLPIKVYYRICNLRHIRIEIKTWKHECVLSFNMGWRILVNVIPRLWLGIKY